MHRAISGEAACVHEQVAKRIANVRFTLVQILDSENYVFYHEDVRTVLEISREIFKGNFDKINDKYKDREMESELISVIGKITDSVDLINEADKKEVKSMCTALEKLKEDSRNEGRKEGHENGLKAGREEERKDLIIDWTKDGYTVSDIAKLLKKNFEKTVSSIDFSSESAKMYSKQ